MDYKVVVTIDAENDLDQFINYLIYEKKSFSIDLSIGDHLDKW